LKRIVPRAGDLAIDRETRSKRERVRAANEVDGNASAADDSSCIEDGGIPAETDACAPYDRSNIGNVSRSRIDSRDTSRNGARIGNGGVSRENAVCAVGYRPGIGNASGAGGTDASAARAGQHRSGIDDGSICRKDTGDSPRNRAGIVYDRRTCADAEYAPRNGSDISGDVGRAGTNADDARYSSEVDDIGSVRGIYAKDAAQYGPKIGEVGRIRGVNAERRACDRPRVEIGYRERGVIKYAIRPAEEKYRVCARLIGAGRRTLLRKRSVAAPKYRQRNHAREATEDFAALVRLPLRNFTHTVLFTRLAELISGSFGFNW